MFVQSRDGGCPCTASGSRTRIVSVIVALALGWLIQKTDSIWGPVLAHAGMDISVMIGILSNMPGS